MTFVAYLVRLARRLRYDPQLVKIIGSVCMNTEPHIIYPTDRDSLERDCDMTFYTAGGPGGQHRNRVATGVRLVHRPSGMVVTATERRSQSANRDVAFERMAERLQARNVVAPPRRPTRPSKASLVRRREQKDRRAAVKRARRSFGEE